MRIVLICCWFIISVVLTQGCATSKQFQQIQNEQASLETLVQEQSDLLFLQQEQIKLLESDKQFLFERLYDLELEVESLRQQKSVVTPVPAPRGKPKKVVEKPPEKRDSAFDKVVLGRVEWVWFELFDQSLETRIDTSIKSSIIYASNIQYFERDGDEWVRFSLRNKDVPLVDQTSVEEALFEVPVVKKIRVKNSSGNGSTKRAAVRLRIRVGKLVDDSLFLLSDKEASSHSVVMGRTFLRDIAVVDKGRSFTQPKLAE